jgi:hypothetical protein
MNALHDLTISAIRRAQSQGGTVDPVEDWAAIADLDKLARASTELTPEDRLLFLDLPVIVGNVSIYRLSWSASEWLIKLAMDWYTDDSFMLDRSIVFAHANARTPEIFRRCSNMNSASAEVLRWSRECSASIEALLKAVDIFTPAKQSGQDDKPEKERSISSNGPILHKLMADYHQPINYFLWEISAEALTVLIRANILDSELESGFISTASGKAPDVNSRMTKATVKFQRAARLFVSSIVGRKTGALK